MRITQFILLMAYIYTSSAQEVEALDGNIYKVGDFLHVGNKSGRHDNYNFIKETQRDTRNDIYYKTSKQDFFDKKYKIKSISKMGNLANELRWNEGDILVTFISDSLSGNTFYVNLNSAINSGEIVSLVPPNGESAKNNVISDSIAFAFYIKTNKLPYEKFIEEYLYRFKNDLFDKYWNDEFEYKGLLEVGNNEINSIIQKLDYDIEYSYYTTLLLEEYDFESSGFSVYNNEIGAVLLKNGDYGAYPSLWLTFLNYDDFRFVGVDKDMAKSFVKRRKDEDGFVDREVYAKVNYKISSKIGDVKETSYFKDKNSIWAEIVNIELYEFDNYYYNWLGKIE